MEAHSFLLGTLVRPAGEPARPRTRNLPRRGTITVPASPASRPFGRRARLFCATLCGSFLLLLSACSDEEHGTADSAALAPSSECAAEDGPLRIYVNDWGEAIPDGFTEHTGIETEVADLGGGELLARVAAEANNPRWDVLVLVGHGSVEGMNEQGQLLTDYPLENLDNLTAEGRELLPEDNAWIPLTGHAAAVIAYNTEMISEEEAPQSWAELTDPAYAPIGIADPAAAAPAYPVISWFWEDLGSEGAEEYFDALADNGLNTYDRNGPVAQAVASGEVPVAMLQEHNLYGLLDDGEPVDFVWPEEGAPGGVRAAAISADTPRPCASVQLVDWMLSEQGMSYLMAEGGRDSFVTPFVEGADTSNIPAERPQDGELLITDAEFAAEMETEIKDWFSNRMSQ